MHRDSIQNIVGTGGFTDGNGMSNTSISDLDVVGMWVTADGHIRQELLPNGRYDEARGNTPSAYTGAYTVTGAHLDYRDDTGFTATGDIRDGVLYHEHLVLYRETATP